MNKSDYVIALILMLAVVLAVKYFQPGEPEPQVQEKVLETPEQPVTVQVEDAEIRYPVPKPVPPEKQPGPVPEAAPEAVEPQVQQALSTQPPATEPAPAAPDKPLPPLDDSDDRLRTDLYTIATKQALDSLFNLNRIIRRFVVTVDNLPRRHLLKSKYRSNQAVRGRLTVEKDSHGFYLSDNNFARYEPYVALLESVDSDRLLALYVHYYPLIQAAYEDLGYPSAYFNDRLIDVIDHLLAAPDISGRISLLRPHVVYKFADPELEALSAGQKLFVRMGPANAARVKSKLQALRRALAGE